MLTARRRGRAGPVISPLDAALRFLAVRPRSEAEVRTRLLRAGHEATAIEQTLERLRQDGLLDDAAFAQYWLEQRRTFRPRGARLVQAELRQRGIAADLAAEAATTLDTPEEDAYRAAFKRAHQLAHLEERAFRDRIGQLLARRGFNWDTIAPVVARLWSELAA